MQIITHRGLDPSKQNFFMESSIEAFVDHLKRGYGLEFDVRVTRDKKMVVIHDATLKRITKGKDIREINTLDAEEIVNMNFDGSHITTLDTLLEILDQYQSPKVVSALHLKSDSQRSECLDILIAYLKTSDTSKLYIFDTRLESAEYLKKKIPHLRIAPSVSHPYDIQRFGEVTGGTLLSVKDVFYHRELFDGVWLDEWDLADENGGTKQFYTQEVIRNFKNSGLWVGLVTPELHATSPGLLGGEAHPDAEPQQRLYARIKEIISYKPDAICTDYPDQVRLFEE